MEFFKIMVKHKLSTPVFSGDCINFMARVKCTMNELLYGKIVHKLIYRSEAMRWSFEPFFSEPSVDILE